MDPPLISPQSLHFKRSDEAINKLALLRQADVRSRRTVNSDYDHTISSLNPTVSAKE